MIEIDNLVKHYNGFPALRGISFTVNDGDIFGFIGPNGSGKTTTMRILATLLDQTSGTATVDGHCVVSEAREVRGAIGYMPDNFGVYERVSVYEYLDFFAAAHRIPYRERKEVIEQAIALTDLGSLRDRPTSELSKGMRRRLLLARSLAHNPKVLILDEPAEGLDPRARIEFRALLKELREMGKTILISSHILTELSDICNAVAIIEKGEIIAAGDIEAIKAKIAPHRSFAIETLTGAEIAEAILLRTERVKNVTRQERVIAFNYTGEREGIAEVVKMLVAQGVGIITIEERKTNLEGLFMELTKGEVG